MRLLSEVAARLGSLFRWNGEDDELEEELRFHLERETEKYVDAGVSRSEARRRAHLHLGGLAQVRERTREARGVAVVENWLRDIRLSLRSLARTPVYTAVSAGTLALGIGAVTAIFTVLNGVLLEPLPFDDPDELVMVTHRAPGWGEEDWSVALSQFVTYEAENRVFDGLGAFGRGRASVTGVGEAERVPSLTVSWELLPVLGVEPVLGRLFTEADDTPSAPETVMLAHGYWQSRFGSDPGVLGRTLQMNGRPYTVIGVLPPDFDMPEQDPSVVTPIQLPREGRFRGYSYALIGRLAPGVSLAEAAADVNRLIPIATERYGGASVSELEEAGFEANLRPLKGDYVGDVASTLWVLFGSVLIVLVIAWANAANLVLVRMEGRQGEVALRSALGARGGQLLRHFLLETLVLGALGGLAGIGLAAAGVRLLLRMAPDGIPRLNEIAVNAPVLGVALVLAVATGLLLALLPVLHAGSMDIVASLKGGGPGSVSGARRQWARRALVVAQVAMALVLLVGSGLMLRSFQALREVDPGFRAPEDVVTFRVTVPESEIEGADAVARAYEQMAGRISEIPGVESVGAASSLTMEGLAYDEAVSVEDGLLDPDEPVPQARTKEITAGYFETMRIPVLAGRAIEWPDVRDGAAVVVVTRGFAEAHWGDAESAIGRRVARGALASQMLGPRFGNPRGRAQMERDRGGSRRCVRRRRQSTRTRRGFLADPELGILHPPDMSFAVRTSRPSTSSIVAEVRRAVAEVSPNLPVSNVGTLDQILARSMARTSFTLLTLLVAAVVALLLGFVGIYGVVSYVVSQRTREIGVRIALGAGQGEVSAMVVRQGAVLAGIGVAVGLVAAAGTTRLMALMLFGVEATDPLTFAAVAGLLMVVAVAASYLPARRAARMDPVEALRLE